MAANRESAGLGDRDERDLSGGTEDVAIAPDTRRPARPAGLPDPRRGNAGALAGPDDDAVVEVPCVDAKVAHPRPGSRPTSAGTRSPASGASRDISPPGGG